MSLVDIEDSGTPERENPIDVVEALLGAKNWPHERADEDEISTEIKSVLVDLKMSFTWLGEIEVLMLCCAFDFKVPEQHRGQIEKLILLANEKLWVGHFELWTKEGSLMFRHGSVLTGGAPVSLELCEALIQAAANTCEKFYPAFNHVRWSNTPAHEALEAAIFETEGEA